MRMAELNDSSLVVVFMLIEPVQITDISKSMYGVTCNTKLY